MSKNALEYGLCFFLFLFAGCTKAPHITAVHWSSQMSSEQDRLAGLETIYSIETAQKDQFLLNTSQVEWKEQVFMNLPVFDSWVKLVFSSSEIENYGAQVVLGAKKLVLPSSFSDHFFSSQTQRFQEASGLSKIDSCRRGIKILNGDFSPIWRIHGFDLDHEFWEVDLNSSLEMVSRKRGRAEFSDTIDLEAMAYPRGPLQSSLRRVSLFGLLKGKFLQEKHLVVTTAAEEAVVVGSHPLNFSIEDSRFDQVQVFFTLQQAYQWFAQELGWTWAGQLTVETSLGHPDKTNSAFYYGNKIRLGEGDGVTYKGIPKDPSIVIHESVHALVDRMARLPFQGEGGSLNEAFADFLTSSYLNRPYMGEVAYLKGSYRRRIDEPKSWSERSGQLYADSLIVSSFLWELRSKVGVKAVHHLVTQVLRDLYPDDNLNSFKEKFLRVARAHLEPQDVSEFNELASDRGWL